MFDQHSVFFALVAVTIEGILEAFAVLLAVLAFSLGVLAAAAAAFSALRFAAFAPQRANVRRRGLGRPNGQGADALLNLCLEGVKGPEVMMLQFSRMPGAA